MNNFYQQPDRGIITPELSGIVNPNIAFRGPNGMLSHFPLKNTSGDFDLGSSGFTRTITTLSEIRAGIIEQIFFEIFPGDYMVVDVGSNPWMDEIIQYVEFSVGGSFYDGDIKTNSTEARNAQVQSALSDLRMPQQFWAKSAGWTIIQVQQAAASTNWQYIEAQMKSLKKDWQLGIQRTAFYGHPSRTAINGLLNIPDVTVNTVLITKPISSMTDAEFVAFCAGLIEAYRDNCNRTTWPTHFVIPESDYNGLSTPTSTVYNTKSRIQYMKEIFEGVIPSQYLPAGGFQILPLAYADAARMNAELGLNVNRYSLYKKDPETGRLNIPIDFDILDTFTKDGLNYSAKGHGQYSGYFATRVAEHLYFDNAP